MTINNIMTTNNKPTHKNWVIGNWKQNPDTPQHAATLCQQICQQLNPTPACHVGIAPSFLHIDRVYQNLLADNLAANSAIWLGVQDICATNLTTGAFTGDISATQACHMNAKFAIIGHSERRQYHHESNQMLAQKITYAQSADLLPIFCIGESQTDYHANNTLSTLQAQLDILTKAMTDKPIIIAYEPIWAIGTGLIPSLDEIDRIHQFIKSYISNKFGTSVDVLYGGSVNDDNAYAIAHLTHVNGVLVGTASLKPEAFCRIVDAFTP